MTRSTDISPLSVLLARVDAIADGVPSGDTIPCGFLSLDKMLGGGFRRGDLIVLGGDIGSGKSALALAIAIRAALREARVAYLTAEATVDRVLERIIAIEARARIDDLRNGTLDDAARANAGAVALRLREHLPLVERIDGHSIEEFERQLEVLPERDLVVVDSISALAPGLRPLDEEIATVVGRLKGLALQHHVPILAIAPLPHLTARPDRRPILDDFAALGAVKQHADVVLALFRQDMYEPARDIEGATELFVRKNRNGPIGYVDLYFYAHWMRFEDMLDPDR
ncbi:MAG TPA: DnaB-like helicase C-terminal domain-containing protein [Gemmatimonadaceae bacterium]|jgi:replicative DNA helicase|nr:DnaB-like helicase C-terminal domain-containing protein [Gemmatimonadaceae bacterium]